MHQLRVALDLHHGELQIEHVFPGVAHFLEKQARDPRYEAQFYLRQWPAGQGADLAAAAQHAVDDGIKNRWIDVENQIAFQGLGLEQIEASRIFQAEHEFAVGELIHAGELYFNDGPQ